MNQNNGFNLDRFFTRINEIQRNAERLAKSASKRLVSIVETANLVSKRLSEYFNSKDWLDTLQNIIDGIEQSEKDVKVFKAAMVTLDYPPHHSLDFFKLRFIAQDYRINGREHVSSYIDDFMINYYDAELLSELCLGWETSKALESRRNILRSIVRSHNLKMYEVSVPTAISQLEGIIVDAFKFKGRSDGEIIKILLKNLLLKEGFKSEFSFDREINDYYSKKVLISFEHGKVSKSSVSRNAILHGADTNYAKETTSLKLILLIDYLIDSVQSLTDEQRETAMREIKVYRDRKRRLLNRSNNRKKR